MFLLGWRIPLQGEGGSDNPHGDGQDEINRLAILGDRARNGITAAFNDAGVPGQVTGLQSLLRIHVHNRALSDYRSSLMSPQEKTFLSLILSHMRDDGIFVNERGVCSLSTPMGDAEIDAFLACFRGALDAAKDAPQTAK